MTTSIQDQLHVRVQPEEWCSHIEACGQVYPQAAAQLGQMLQIILKQPGSAVSLDLRETTFLADPGVEALLKAQSAAAEAGALETHVLAGSQPEQVLRESAAHRHFSVTVWDAPLGGTRQADGVLHADLEIRLPSKGCQVALVRRITEQVMQLAGVDDGPIQDFILAVGEAAANAVTHGSPPGSPGYVIFKFRPGPAVAVAEITDFGPGVPHWNGETSMPAPESIRGRGFGMMNAYADRLEVFTGSDGTRVRLHKLHSPAPQA